ncbi:MAG: hypothetical protein Q8L69_04540, partial [Gallionellaceae bacterium]|nr:hypothetical protein [Gallionellaceae bacterium]
MSLSMYLRMAIVVATLVLQSCTNQPVTPPSPAPSPRPAPAETGASRDVVILVSENIPAYSDVANALADKLGRRGTI